MLRPQHHITISDALSCQLGVGDNKVIINNLHYGYANPYGLSRVFSYAVRHARSRSLRHSAPDQRDQSVMPDLSGHLKE